MWDWEWYKTPNMVHVYTHLLLKANHSSTSWQGVVVHRGQLISGRRVMATETGLSEQAIRSCLNRLQSTSEITIKTTNKYSVITLCNYEKYQHTTPSANQRDNQQSNQPPNQPPNQQSTSEPTNNQPHLNNIKHNIKHNNNPEGGGGAALTPEYFEAMDLVKRTFLHDCPKATPPSDQDLGIAIQQWESHKILTAIGKCNSSTVSWRGVLFHLGDIPARGENKVDLCHDPACDRPSAIKISGKCYCAIHLRIKNADLKAKSINLADRVKADRLAKEAQDEAAGKAENEQNATLAAPTDPF
jgi:hypothetical protein